MYNIIYGEIFKCSPFPLKVDQSGQLAVLWNTWNSREDTKKYDFNNLLKIYIFWFLLAEQNHSITLKTESQFEMSTLFSLTSFYSMIALKPREIWK